MPGPLQQEIGKVDNKEEFERLVREIDPGASFKRHERGWEYASITTLLRLEGYQLRQSEIDALKKERNAWIEKWHETAIENAALKAENERLREDAERYRYLRDRDLTTIHQGGIFAGLTPDNVVVNGDHLDRYIDAAMEGK